MDFSKNGPAAGAEGTVQDGLFPSTYKVDYTLAHTPLVSILIPNKDHTEDLDKALRSILEKTDYPAYEVIVIENNSTQPQTFAYYETIARDAAYSRCRVVQYQGPFNFSAINNFGRAARAPRPKMRWGLFWGSPSPFFCWARWQAA